MNPLTHFKKTKILRNIFLSLGAIFALVTAAHAQNLYVSAQCPPRIARNLGIHARWDAENLRFGVVCSLEGWPLIASAIFSRQKPSSADDHDIGKVLKFNLRNKVNTVGSVANFFFEGLAIDIDGQCLCHGE